MPQAQELVTLLVAELEVDPNRKADNGMPKLPCIVTSPLQTVRGWPWV
jgi:hypothetical protein